MNSQLNRNRLLCLYRNWRKPIVLVGLRAVEDSEELFLQRLRNRSDLSIANLDFVYGANWGDFGGCAGEEDFVADVEHLARDHLLEDRNTKILGQRDDGVAGDARKDGVSERRSHQLALAHNEQVFAGAFAYVAVHVESDTFDVAVHDGFHLYELRIHVVRARLCHCGHSVWSETRPRRDADVNAFIFVSAEVLTPRIISYIHLGRRTEWIYADLSIAAKHDRPQIAR